MTTYPLATLACTVDENGISAPSYVDILESLKAQYRSIYGSDVYLEADSQDGQFLAIFAAGINDCNAATIAAYNNYSPATAKGVGLSNAVKINNLTRHVASNSTADVTITGTVGTVITNGVVGDAAGNRWALPASVTIPTPAAFIVVTATCQTIGDVEADANTITEILTPTLGWLSVTNAAAATPGAPVETDGQLRLRQQESTALGAESPLKAIRGAVASITGVTRFEGYENDTNVTDADGITPHSVAMVVEGGDAQEIATVIFDKKGPGTGTFGTTTESVLDPYGVPKDVKFSRPDIVDIKVELSIHPVTGYTSTIQDALVQAVADYVNGLGIGDDIVTTRLYLPANLYGAQPDSSTFELTLIRIAKLPDAFGTADIDIAFDEAAALDVSDITVIII